MGFVNRSLENIPIEQLIATPLMAAGAAQEMLARVTINFIKSIGLQVKDGSTEGALEAITVDFSYTDVINTDGDGPIGSGLIVEAAYSIGDTSINVQAREAVTAASLSGAAFYNKAGEKLGDFDTTAVSGDISASTSGNTLTVAAPGLLKAKNQYDEIYIQLGDNQSSQTTRLINYQVPLLAIVWVPSLFIQTVDVDFEAKINQSSVTTSKISASTKFKAWYSPWKFSASGSVTNTTKKNYSATYRVQVHAEDKGYPEGLEKIIDALTSAVGTRE